MFLTRLGLLARRFGSAKLRAYSRFKTFLSFRQCPARKGTAARQ